MGKLSDALFALDKDRFLRFVRADLDSGRNPLDLIEEARQGLQGVGEEFEKGNLFLMELMRAAQIFKSAAALITPRIKEKGRGEEIKGKVLVGTVSGDVHDLGKGIVASLLECEGFEVVDLGVDVPESVFAAKVKEHNPQVVGMSGLLTTSIPVMGRTVQALADAGLRRQVKIIAGGGIVGEVDASRIGADFTTSNANEGVRMINEWTRKRG